MAKFLVTGGCGFLGSHIAKHLVDDGHQVYILDDLSGGFEENKPDGAKFILGSITDTFLVNNLFDNQKFDYVYHCAAYAAEGLSHFVRRYNYENNVIGSINLINASINNGVKGFIFMSSMAVYGTQQVPYEESMKPQPEDPYGISKYTIEQDLKSAYEMFDLNYMIIRPHNIYGKHQNIGDKYRNVIARFMNQIMGGKDVTIYGDGKQTRAFSYIDDMAPILSKVWDKPEMYQQIFNIGGDVSYTINDLADKVINAMDGDKSKIVHLSERYEVKHAYSNHKKIRDHFDLPQTSLDDGLKEMAAWAKEHGFRESKQLNYEVTDKMFEAWL